MGALRNAHFRLFTGAFLISFSPVFVRLVSVPPTSSAFYRTFFGAIALSAYLVSTRRRRPRRRIFTIAIGSAAVFFALDLWFWHRSVLLVGPGLSTLLANLQVFFMILAGWFFFRETPRRIQLFAAALAIFGLALLVEGDWAALEPGYRLGVVFGLLTAVSYAGYLLSLRQARTRSSDPLPIMEVTAVSIAVAVLLGIVSVAEGNSLAITSFADLSWLLAYGILSHACGWLLIASSLTAVTAAEVGIALLLQPALSLSWDVLLFGRAFTPVEVIGVLLTLAAIFFGSLRRVS